MNYKYYRTTRGIPDYYEGKSLFSIHNFCILKLIKYIYCIIKFMNKGLLFFEMKDRFMINILLSFTIFNFSFKYITIEFFHVFFVRTRQILLIGQYFHFLLRMIKLSLESQGKILLMKKKSFANFLQYPMEDSEGGNFLK